MKQKPKLATRFEIEPDGSNDYGPCECCGHMTRTVWGYIHEYKTTVAVYYVSWTLKKVEHGATFDLILGKWDETSSAKDRFSVSLAYRRVPEGGGFMIIDASGRVAPATELVGAALKRKEVVGTPIAKQAFDLVDEIYIQDRRLAEIRRWFDA